jgi:hypothetical protein
MLQAAFLSSRVHGPLHHGKVDSISVEFEAGNTDERVFGLLERLLNGVGIPLVDSQVDGLLGIAAFMGNDQLLNQFTQYSSIVLLRYLRRGFLSREWMAVLLAHLPDSGLDSHFVADFVLQFRSRMEGAGSSVLSRGLDNRRHSFDCFHFISA